MILSDLLNGNEAHPAYQQLEVENGERHYDFLRSAVQTALEVQRPFLSQTVIKALNFHAVVCLHAGAGEYRPCQVHVGDYVPPPHHQVATRMDDFVNDVNRHWDSTDAITLAAFTLWRLNHIHPFINGNGRTARAACYFVLCLKVGGWIGGAPILPQLLKANRDELIACLKEVDASLAGGTLDLGPLCNLVESQLNVQLSRDVEPS